MLLIIAFACFFVMFAAWLIVPNVEDKAVATSSPEPIPAGSPNLQTQA